LLRVEPLVQRPTNVRVAGVRGGADQCCHISAELLPRGKVVLG
jgi:hypothetical protein